MHRISLFLIVPLALLGACTGKEPAPQASSEPPGEVAALATDSAATPPSGFVSHYTSLDDCKVVQTRPDEDWSTSRCPGEGGYSLVLNYGDARDALDVLQNGSKIAELKLYLRGGGGFNTLGKTIEWRGKMIGDRFEPVILIVRNKVHRQPDRPERTADLLEVFDLKRRCTLASLEPQPGQNEAARALADAGQAPCLQEPA